jgi:hypothetical protein
VLFSVVKERIKQLPKKTTTLCLMILFTFSLAAQKRSLDAIFPGLDAGVRNQVLGEGFITSSTRAAGFTLLPSVGLEGDLTDYILRRQPACLIESLRVLPETGANLEDVFGALQNIRNLKGRLYYSETRRSSVPLFEEATRIEGPKKHTPLTDPPLGPAAVRAETVYLRLKDANFGNTYYRGDIVPNGRGLLYHLSNTKTFFAFLIPVIKEGKFTARIYFEPVEEGILVYSIAGADVSDFIASNIDMPSAIGKRLTVILSWVTDGIKNVRGK